MPIRVIVQVQARVAILTVGETPFSLGGMAMYAGAELKLGDQVWVEFTPPYSSPPVRVDAVIGNRTGYYYGLEFLTATSSQPEQTASFERPLSTLTSSADRCAIRLKCGRAGTPIFPGPWPTEDRPPVQCLTALRGESRLLGGTFPASNGRLLKVRRF